MEYHSLEFPSPYRGLFLIRILIIFSLIIKQLVSVPLSGIVSYTKRLMFTQKMFYGGFRPLIGDCFLYYNLQISRKKKRGFRPLIGDCFLYLTIPEVRQAVGRFPSPYRGLFLIQINLGLFMLVMEKSFRPLIGDCFLYLNILPAGRYNIKKFPSPYRGLFLIHNRYEHITGCTL